MIAVSPGGRIYLSIDQPGDFLSTKNGAAADAVFRAGSSPLAGPAASGLAQVTFAL
jgi:hypothetical protein